MTLLISDSFTESLGRLTGDEQKAVKTTAFDLQMNPASPGMRFHKLDRAKDKNFWSVRVNADIRVIVHKTASSLLLCYVDHHDKAYAWAERRRLETHPATGAAQLVEIREKVQEVLVPVYVQQQVAAPPKPTSPKLPLFSHLADDVLLGYGVPVEWLKDAKQANEDTLFTLADHLPAEAAEALLELATGGKPRKPELVASTVNPFDHPDAQRRFRTVANLEDLKRALNYPWEKWTIYLHPDQRQLVEKDYSGPARVSGSAGTGKTIVALHRAAHLARSDENARVLLTTFSNTLASALQAKLKRLLGDEPGLGERIDVYSLESVGQRLYTSSIAEPKVASRDQVRQLLQNAAAKVSSHKFGQHFVLSEWEHVVDAWQLDSWDAYRDVVRLGRKTRLAEAQRKLLWSIFTHVREALKTEGLITPAELFTATAKALAANRKVVFDYVVVDEAQDLSVAHMRFISALGGGRSNSIFFAGDLGQRIFQQPFSWKALGVDVRGRSRTLRVNYRTSHQIRAQADLLLGPVMTDVDGNTEDRSDAVSVFNGPPPSILTLKSEAAEVDVVADWLKARAKDGILPHEFGVFVRSTTQLARPKSAVEKAGLGHKVLDDQVETTAGYVSISTMHLAKGLEFRAIAIMACDDEVLPLQERIEAVGDDGDLQEVYATERQLLYVAATRARDHLLITSVDPASEFLDDMRAKSSPRRTPADA
jgi:superfamily I DNA/RNA helicase/mRNA-degrading endonuclease RelE of RelBE toxin-antitoxin system